MSKRVLITGGNSGIGLRTAEQLAARGAEVILACRDQTKGQAAVARIKNLTPGARVRLFQLDLADLDQVRQSANRILDKVDRVDVLINNAGVVPTRQQYTADGFEMQFGVNYLAPVLLTHQLLPALRAADSARIVHVASVAHWLGRINPKTWRGRRPYLVMDAYGQSKLANILFSDELARRLANHGITSNALHPGGVDTGIFRHVPKPAMALIRPTLTTPERAARLPVRMALDSEFDGVSGGYFDAKGQTLRSPRARNQRMAQTLYQDTTALLGLQPL
ncbi:MAG: SDR family oxidoreductase [Alcanivorax sp.]|nr:SDR family oxidoreductase [Alcanivorax sp.]